MADDTLSRVMPFSGSPIVKTRMTAEHRYALGQLHLEEDGLETSFGFIRRVLVVGLDALGWPEERRIEEYARFRQECLAGHSANPYESE